MNNPGRDGADNSGESPTDLQFIGPLIDASRSGRFRPNERVEAIDDAVKQLLRQNGLAVAEQIRVGERNFDLLLDRLTTWQEPASVAFLGLRVTTHCNVGRNTTMSRCLMCDQKLFNDAPWYRELGDWQAAIDQATQQGRNRGVLVNISGGEPLLRPDGICSLIRYAADRGAVVNLNSNGHALNLELALRLIAAGLAKLHISMHGASRITHERIQPTTRAYARTVRGIESVARAKTIAHSDYPVLHLNYVLTRDNIEDYPATVAWGLARRRSAPYYHEGNTHTNPNRRDLCVHLLALVGESYENLAPRASDLTTFNEEIFPKAEQLWRSWLGERGVAADKQCSYADLIVKDYFDASVSPRFERMRKCHVAATQSYWLPDGSAYICGRHADHADGWGSIGRLGQSELPRISFDAARGNCLPSERCGVTCAANTRQYNLMIEARLAKHLRGLLEGANTLNQASALPF